MGDEIAMGSQGEARGADGIEGETSLGEADFARAARLGLQPFLVWPIAMVVFFLFHWRLGHGRASDPSGAPAWVALGVPLAGMAVLAGYFLIFVRRARIRRITAEFGGNTKFRIDDFGVSSMSARRQHRVAWSTLLRFVEQADVFYVYTSPQAVLILPKRAFHSAAEPEIRRLLNERIVTKLQPPMWQRPRAIIAWLVCVLAFLAIWRFLE